MSTIRTFAAEAMVKPRSVRQALTAAASVLMFARIRYTSPLGDKMESWTNILRETGKIALEIRLDIPFAEFPEREPEFVEVFSEVLGVPATDVWIADTRSGCVILVTIVPDTEARLFLAAIDLGHSSPKLATFKRLMRFVWAREAGTVTETQLGAGTSKGSDFARSDQDSVTWLHISDLHLRETQSGEAFEQSVVVSRFVEQLPKLLGKRNLRPDFIFFTGDVAHSAKDKEYTAALDLLRSIRSSFGNSPQIMVIAGNHDISWDLVDLEKEAKIRNSLADKNDVSSFLLDQEQKLNREVSALRLKRFYKFQQDCSELGQPELNHGYFYTTTIERGGLRIGIAGMNSAWRSTRKPNPAPGTLSNDLDLGHLLLGEPQLRAVRDDLEGADVRIGLLHHPPMDSWFKDFDKELQAQYLVNLDYLLRGHEHMFSAARIKPLDVERPDNETTIMSTGALYQTGRMPKLFLAVRLKLSSPRTQTIYKWSFAQPSGQWVPNTDSGLPVIRTALPIQLRKRLKSKSTE